MRAGSTPAGAWALGVMGCGDECQPYTGKCEGNTAWRCISPENGTATWGRAQDCGALFCRSSSFGAVCASSKDLDPVCSESLTLPQDGVCAGSIRIACGLGYRLAVLGDCQDPALCYPDLCMAVGESDPVCEALLEPNLYVRTACRQNGVLVCREGRLASLEDCGTRQCTVGSPPPAGAQWCFPTGKCVPYAPEPISSCQ